MNDLFLSNDRLNAGTHTSSFSAAAALILLSGVILLSSCGKTDTEPPTICTETGTEFSVLAEEIEAMAGTQILISDSFCDNEELSEVRWDVHNAADHAHEEGDADEGFVLHSGTNWEVLETSSLAGTSDDASLTLNIPLTARGVWDVVVSLVDAEGNAATDVVTQLHIENEHIPEFSLLAVDGVDPATWPGEPSWAQGSTVNIEGSVTDSDGLNAVQILLVRESDETVIWEAPAAEPDGVIEFTFAYGVVIPANADAGEYHVEMRATDAAGNETETGFHVEIE